MKKYWKPAFWLCALAVLVLSLVPVAPELPTTGWDKSNHFLGFASLAFLGLPSYPRHRIFVLGGLILYGGLIEVLQSLTTYRLAEWGDLLADAIGVAIGYYINLLFARMLPRHKN
jgi:VanZ family protein